MGVPTTVSLLHTNQAELDDTVPDSHGQLDRLHLRLEGHDLQHYERVA